MLSTRETEAIKEAIARYPARRNACIEALNVVKDRQGWVSDDAIADIAAILEMSSAEVDAVASFYNLIHRKPVGRHVIFVCDSVSCWLLRYQQILDHLRNVLGIQFGDTTADDRFTLLPIQCLGACDHAPAMVIDEDFYGDLTPQKVDTILEKYE